MISVLLCLALQNSALQSPALTVDPPQAVVGQPLSVQLVLTHPVGTEIGPKACALDLDETWVLVDGPTLRTVPEGGERQTTARWTLLSLEPGARSVPGFQVTLNDGQTLQIQGAQVEVSGELGEEEDAPRPLPSLHPVSERTGPLRPAHLGWAALALMVGVWAWSRRSRPDAHEIVQGEWARFQDLLHSRSDTTSTEAENCPPLATELAALLRSAMDRRMSKTRAGASDEEWLAALRADGMGERADELAPLLETCAGIKFGGVRPTRFALEELLASVESALRKIAPDAPSQELASTEDVTP